MDRMQASMAVVEGYAEHVMDEASAGEPELELMRERMDARRAHRAGVADTIARFLGLGQKLRQYELGKQWCDAVAAEAGIDGLDRVWESPKALPSLEELEAPSAWMTGSSRRPRLAGGQAPRLGTGPLTVVPKGARM